jgi:dTDP-4-dehydrorhamnose 3,5-epimerase
MPFQEMKIKGAWIHTPLRHNDERGHFEEQFKLSQIEAELGRTFIVKQVNQSVSKKGVVRGIHCTTGSIGQAKYVSCPYGAVIDFVVDLRIGSKTFGQWDMSELSAENGRSVLISESLGHAFLSLVDSTTVQYLCSQPYNEENDFFIDVFDEDIALPLDKLGEHYDIEKLVLSTKDEAGKSLKQFLKDGLGANVAN